MQGAISLPRIACLSVQRSVKTGLKSAVPVPMSLAMSADTDVEVLNDAAVAAPAPAIDKPEPPSPTELVEGWTAVTSEFAALLHDAAPNAAWIETLEAAKARMQALAGRDFDGALYLLLQAASGGEDRYSTHHAMLCALVGEVCADWFAWPAAEVDSLVCAALTMNLSMSAMQDTLSRQLEPLSSEQREHVDGHAERSAAMLAEGGAKDALWIEVVRRHHDADLGAALDAAAPAQRLAHLLHRVDVYTAKLSRRTSRDAVSPAIATRDTSLGEDGRPDAIGVALMRKLGLYPPGSFVKLANGDLGVVVRRGAKAHTPIVAALRREDGALHMSPKRRDTARPEHAVAHGVTAADVKVHLNHRRNLAAG